MNEPTPPPIPEKGKRLKRRLEPSIAFVMVTAILVIGIIAVTPAVAWVTVALLRETTGTVPANETVAISAISMVGGFVGGLIGGQQLRKAKEEVDE